MNNIVIKKGDITKSEDDAIVNAANPKTLGGGGVDGAIHRAAGPKLLEECQKVKAINGVRCPFGEARITLSGNLKSKYVIHTVGPIYNRTPEPKKVLKSAYENSCNLALENNCRSIAFPGISCGAYGYPHKEAAEIAIATCTDKKYSELMICFYIFESDLYDVFKEVFAKLRRGIQNGV